MRNNRELAWQASVGATIAFARACREISARLVFVSTDWVYDGMTALVSEHSATRFRSTTTAS